MATAQPRPPWFAGALLALAASCVVAQTTGDALLVKRGAELREAPGDAARSLAPLALQTPLTRLPARQGAWIQVRMANGTTGWVHMFDVGTGSAPSTTSNAATGALRGISNFFNRGSAQANTTTATSTVGIRGLGAEDIANAQPNLAALSQVDAMRQDATQARRFAANAALQIRIIEPLPAPPAPVAAGATSNRYQLP